MRFLIDANLSPRLASLLSSGEHDAVAVRQVGLADASDSEIMDYAVSDDRIVGAPRATRSDGLWLDDLAEGKSTIGSGPTSLTSNVPDEG